MLGEIELPEKIAELGYLFPHGGTQIGASIGERIESLPVEKQVLDELQVGVKAECLVVDEPASCERADHHAGNAESVAEAVDLRWLYVVVISAPVVPRDEYRGALPLGPPAGAAH